MPFHGPDPRDRVRRQRFYDKYLFYGPGNAEGPDAAHHRVARASYFGCHWFGLYHAFVDDTWPRWTFATATEGPTRFWRTRQQRLRVRHYFCERAGEEQAVEILALIIAALTIQGYRRHGRAFNTRPPQSRPRPPR